MKPTPPKDASAMCVCGHTSKIHGKTGCLHKSFIPYGNILCTCSQFTPAPAANAEKCANCGADSDDMHHDYQDSPICPICAREIGDSESSPAATSKPSGEDGFSWSNDAPEGFAWKCPDCDLLATIAGNAGFHKEKSGHGTPTLIPIQPPAAKATPKSNYEISRELIEQGMDRKSLTTSDKLKEVADWLIEIAPDNHIDARSICLDAVRELEETKAKLDFLKDKGITVGMMKSSDRPEPYLAYDIAQGSELCDLQTITENIRLERANRALSERCERLEEALKYVEEIDGPKWKAIVEKGANEARKALTPTQPVERKADHE